MAYASRQPLRFAHCDPAGIAYYPRYFEICDAAIEDWTADVLGVTRRQLHLERRLGLPTVDLHARFIHPSQLGDMLEISLTVSAVGRTSVALDAEVRCDHELRFMVRYKQVLMDLDAARSVAWPDDWRRRLTQVLETAAQ